MRLSIQYDSIDRDTKGPAVNFNGYLTTEADVDRALAVLAVVKELLRIDQQQQPSSKEAAE